AGLPLSKPVRHDDDAPPCRCHPSSSPEWCRVGHSFVATTMIATVLARICAIAPNNATLFVGFDMSLSGTVTSEPGPGLGSLRKNKNLSNTKIGRAHV